MNEKYTIMVIIDGANYLSKKITINEMRATDWDNEMQTIIRQCAFDNK